MAVILKLKNEGKDFGYVTLDREVFYGNGPKEKATKFELKKYKDGSNAHYFKVAGTKESYMDVKVATSRIQIVKPFWSVEKSSICAWEHVDNQLRMIIVEKFTGKCLSRSIDDKCSESLYGNIMGTHCEVIIEEV